MRNKLSVVLFAAFVFVMYLSAPLSYAADDLHPKVHFTTDRVGKFFVPMERYVPSSTPSQGTINLNGTRVGCESPVSPIGNCMGVTTYDYQANGSMARQVAINQIDGSVYFVWMGQDADELGEGAYVIPGHRRIHHNVYDAEGDHTGMGGVPGYFFPPGETQATEVYSGYTACTWFPKTFNVNPAAPLDSVPTPGFVCHEDPEGTGYSTWAQWDSFWDFSIPGMYDLALHDDGLDCETEEYIWPVCDAHHEDSSQIDYDVLYVLSHAFSGDDLIIYRNVDGVWDAQGQCLGIFPILSYTICADPNSPAVIICYTDDRVGGSGGSDLDVFYRLSTNYGADWDPPVCVSNYDEDSLWRAFADVSVMISPDGYAHIVSAIGELRSPGVYYNYSARLVHWNVELATNTVSTAHVIDEARYEPIGNHGDPDSWNLYIAKPSVSLCDGNMYALYTKFGGPPGSDGYWDVSSLGFANGELMLAGSFDNGNSWDTAWNLTNSRTPNCDSGGVPMWCSSEHWSNMARYGMAYEGDDTLDIFYIHDRDAGGIPQGSGTWVINNVMHYRFQCRPVDSIPKISLEPNNYNDPTHVGPGVADTVTMKISNIGNKSLAIEGISVGYIDGDGRNWISVGTVPSPIGVGAFENLEVILNHEGELDTLNGDPDPSGWDAYIIIDSDAPSDKDSVFVHLTVASDFNMPVCDTLEIGSKFLHFCNTGRLGGDNDGASFDIPGDCDADLTAPNGDMYLYDASPLIAWNGPEGNQAYTTIFTQTFVDPGTYRPHSELNWSVGDGYNLAQCTLSTTDSIFGVGVDFYAPTDGNNFLIAKYEFTTWNPGLKGMNEVYCGFFLDWDIPADESVDNGSGYDEGDGYYLIWQRGVETEASDEEPTGHNCPTLENDRYGGFAVLMDTPIGAWTAENAPMRSGPAMDSDSLYNRMGQGGTTLYTGEGEDTVIDLHTGVTFDMVDMTAKEHKYTYIVAMATTNTGHQDLVDQIVAAKAWCQAKEICGSGSVCGLDPLDPNYLKPGDANNDEQVNVGDAVKIINFVFKGGDPPEPYPAASGDANGDCQTNVGDAVKIINFVFKGGDPPVTCEEDVASCGEPPFTK